MDHDEPGAMSAYAYALAVRTDWDAIRKQRQKNESVLTSILKPHVKIISGEYSSLYVPFLLRNRDEIQRKLSSEGIFNTIIWPLPENQKEVCGTTRFTEENMLAAPCDQRYTESDMCYIGQEMIRVIQEMTDHHTQR